jgi:hypothetical protein
MSAIHQVLLMLGAGSVTPGDQYWHDVELLLLANEGAGNALTDKSSRGRTLTAFGGAALSASNTDWAASAAAFDGTGDYYTTGPADDFRFLHDGSKWTIEVRMRRPTTAAQTATILDTTNGASTVAGLFLGITTSRELRLIISRNSAGSYVSNYTSVSPDLWPNDNNYHDLCLECDFDYASATNTFNLYIDGTRVDQFAHTGNVANSAEQTRSLYIGRAGTATSADLTGNISFLRITRGVVRYDNATYTVPTQPVLTSASSNYGTYAMRRRFLFSPASGASMYASEPQMVVANDGTVVCAYRRGASHVDNTGYVACKRSSTKGVGQWGSEIVIADEATYDTRNPSIGKDPSSGRLICFYRTLNAPSTHQATYFRTSTDHGATWSSSTNISSELSAAIGPFGTIVETTNGLMQLFYNADVCEALFSTDGGQTWGNRVTVYTMADADTYNEPVAVAIDTSRIVIIARVDQSSGSNKTFAFYKSSDGGATWDAGTQADQDTAATITSAAPAWVAKDESGNVVTVWINRSATPNNPPGRTMYYSVTDAEDFWTAPSDAIDATATEIEAEAMFLRYGSGGSDADFGYPNLVQIPGGQMLVAWYDMPSGSSFRTSLALRSIP